VCCLWYSILNTVYRQLQWENKRYGSDGGMVPIAGYARFKWPFFYVACSVEGGTVVMCLSLQLTWRTCGEREWEKERRREAGSEVRRYL